jgi:hypothetical protein
VEENESKINNHARKETERQRERGGRGNERK